MRKRPTRRMVATRQIRFQCRSRRYGRMRIIRKLLSLFRSTAISYRAIIGLECRNLLLRNASPQQLSQRTKRAVQSQISRYRTQGRVGTPAITHRMPRWLPLLLQYQGQYHREVPRQQLQTQLYPLQLWFLRGQLPVETKVVRGRWLRLSMVYEAPVQTISKNRSSSDQTMAV